MKLVICSIILTMGLVASTPISFMDDSVYISNKTWYTAEFDIVKVHLPPFLANKNKLFFVEADLTNNEHKGLYVLPINDNKNSTARKLLQKGKCITSDAQTVYFGSTDGIYNYDFKNDTVEKFGNITADIKEIKKENGEGNDLIYIVTEDNQLYTVTEKGNRMLRLDAIKNVAEIALDNYNNLYFYEIHEDPETHQPFYEKYGKPKVLVGNRIIEIVNLPDKYSNMKLADIAWAEGAIVIVNNMFYRIFPNGTSVDTRTMFLDLPTAYSMELGIIQVYAHDKKIYSISIFDQIDLQKAVDAALRSIAQVFVQAINNLTEDLNAAISRNP